MPGVPAEHRIPAAGIAVVDDGVIDHAAGALRADHRGGRR
jgi:hypothetical protein